MHEPLLTMERDLAALAQEITEVAAQEQELARRRVALEEERNVLQPAVEFYRRKFNVAPIKELEEPLSPTPTKPEFSSLSEDVRFRAFEDYLSAQGRFRQIGEAIEDLGEYFSGVSRHNLRTTIQGLFEEGRLVMLRYGSSQRYTAYGLPEFVRTDAEDQVVIGNPGRWPETHRSMNEPPSFIWYSPDTESEPEPEPPEEAVERTYQVSPRPSEHVIRPLIS